MNLFLMAHVDIDAKKVLQRLDVQTGGQVQRVIDKSVIDWCMKYCPWDTGTMARSAYTATLIGSGVVVYNKPYAHYQYYGVVYGPNIPIFDDDSGIPTGFWSPPGQKKKPTGRPMDYSKSKEKNGPLAGPFWFERMKADHLNDILEEARSVAGGK